jgi:pilus assembly protein Flp/PilA
MTLANRLREFLRQEDGQDLIEYALLVALISLVAVVAIGTAGSAVNSIFQNITTQLSAAL